MPSLAPELKTAVLKQLNLAEEDPSPHYLDRLMVAYTETVPWETAFRIVRRDEVADTAVSETTPSAA